MANEAPFDVWDGEDLSTEEFIVGGAPEETAMHIDREPNGETPSWSELIEESTGDVLGSDTPVTYFEDEQPEGVEAPHELRDEKDVDLEDLLERQHYAFKNEPTS